MMDSGGKKRVRGKADSFLPLLPSKYTDHPWGYHDVLRSSPDMPWQEQTLPMKYPLAPATGRLMLQGQWFCSGHRHYYACSKHSKKTQCFCWQILHVESSSFSICWRSNVTLNCFKATISVAALLKLSNRA